MAAILCLIVIVMFLIIGLIVKFKEAKYLKTLTPEEREKYDEEFEMDRITW